MNELYVDGGVIQKNPSHLGGTWAYRLLRDGEIVAERSGVVTPQGMDMATISNNLTEMYALLMGLSILARGWNGTIYSDSQVTLGRAFEGWKWNGVPEAMHKIYQAQRARLENWQSWKHVLLAGHPTKVQLAAGIGRNGYPVSEHNVAVDRLCQEEARLFLIWKNGGENG